MLKYSSITICLFALLAGCTSQTKPSNPLQECRSLDRTNKFHWKTQTVSQETCNKILQEDLTTAVRYIWEDQREAQEKKAQTTEAKYQRCLENRPTFISRLQKLATAEYPGAPVGRPRELTVSLRSYEDVFSRTLTCAREEKRSDQYLYNESSYGQLAHQAVPHIKKIFSANERLGPAELRFGHVAGRRSLVEFVLVLKHEGILPEDAISTKMLRSSYRLGTSTEYWYWKIGADKLMRQKVQQALCKDVVGRNGYLVTQDQKVIELPPHGLTKREVTALRCDNI